MNSFDIRIWQPSASIALATSRLIAKFGTEIYI